MQIGEFAAMCGTKISVLRHYDKVGLLVPDYIDTFTGYRYYIPAQIPVFHRITALKKAGFSLAEIKQLLADGVSDEDILRLFDQKIENLTETLQNLTEAKDMMLGEKSMLQVIFTEKNGTIEARSTKCSANQFMKACETLENAIAANGYQRISGYMSYGEPYTNTIEAACTVVQLSDEKIPLNDDINLPFENDESVVGKWRVLGEYAVKEDFYAYNEDLADIFARREVYGERIREICFLPRGERYWCCGWTAGKLLLKNGDGTSVNEYTVEEYDGRRLMFVKLKSHSYRLSGYPTTLVLEQLDNRAYTKDELARRDDIDLPFAEDAAILGKWKAVSWVRNRESFDPADLDTHGLFLLAMDFEAGGKLTQTYVRGKSHNNRWTNGVVLHLQNHTAEHYDIEKIDGTEYLFVECKNGDYIWGGMDPSYVVFVRETE